MSGTQAEPLTKKELSRIALVSLRVARVVMESGGRARVIAQCANRVAVNLGAEFLGLRIGYASLALSLGNGTDTTTRMIEVGKHGVNHRIDQAVRNLVCRTETEKLSAAAVEKELDKIINETPKHSPWIVAVAVGLACAGFGRLLGIDWMAFAPVFVASALGQWLNQHLLSKHMNHCVVAALIAFGCGIVSSVGARLAGSSTINLAMMASILLLVPGVPATNAQTDIMDGHPTMGSARAVSVLMIMVFAAAGIWLAGVVLGVQS